MKSSPGLLVRWERRRSPYGERGLKYPRRDRTSPCLRRSPYGERGLKYFLCSQGSGLPVSLPVWGAWIEMLRTLPRASMTSCRSPYGERGLKCCRCRDQNRLRWSLPVWGAWIEIRRLGTSCATNWSLPVWGAWIEIYINLWQ